MFNNLRRAIIGFIGLSAAACGHAQLSAQETFVPDTIKTCRLIATNLDEKGYSFCFNLPDGQFYAQAFVYFSLENTDLNDLIRNSSQRRTFLSNLGSLLVRNDDTAYFIVRVSALDGSGNGISLGSYPVLTVKRNGPRDYRIARDVRVSSLPTRFIANESSQIYFDIGVLVERQGSSKIAETLGTIARLASVSLPIPGQPNVTDEQKLLREADSVIAGLLSSADDFDTFVPLAFRAGELQAFETSAKLGRYLPQQARARLIVGSRVEPSIFPAAARLVGSSSADFAAPGGSVSDEILRTPVDGKTASTLALSELGQANYIALRDGSSASDYILACQQLASLTNTGKLGLTSDDSNRLRWALMGGNPLMSSQAVRSSPCVAPLILTWSKLGLGSPDQEVSRIPDEYWQLLEVARSEVQRARTLIEDAVSARDRARTAAEAALRGAPETFREKSFAQGRYNYAGTAVQQQSLTLGVLNELAQDRLGNLYEGEFLYIGGDVLFQGFGQYTSANSGDQIGYREYVGSFEGNFGTGHGRITYHDGGIYTGQTSRERAHGFGAYTDPSGTTLYAKFVDGKPEGKAVEIDAEGKRAAGEVLPSGKLRPLGE